MLKDDDELQRIAAGEVPLPVNAAALSIAAGLVAGLALFGATNWLLLRGGPNPGPHLALLSQYFYGYSVSFVGSLIGFAWAFGLAGAATYGGAWIYNRVAGWRAKDRSRATS
jgi:hypothetical protein